MKNNNKQNTTTRNLVGNSISAFGINIRVTKLTPEIIAELKRNTDAILGSKLNDPDIGGIATDYAETYKKLSKSSNMCIDLNEAENDALLSAQQTVQQDIASNREEEKARFFRAENDKKRTISDGVNEDEIDAARFTLEKRKQKRRAKAKKYGYNPDNSDYHASLDTESNPVPNTTAQVFSNHKSQVSPAG